MARSNRKSRQSAPVVAEQAIPAEVVVAETTIPEAKTPIETTETTASEAIETIETIEASEPVAETTVADLQAEAATGSSEQAEVAEAPPAGLSKDDWIVPGPCTKRVGTDAHRSFQCYGEGCTVESYLANKGHSSRRKARESLRWDIARGLVSIGVRPVADEQATEEAQEEAIREVAEVA